MDKKERYQRYKYTMGLSAWEIGSFKDQSFKIVVNDGPNGLRKPTCNEFDKQDEIIKTICLPSISALAATFDKKACYLDGEIIAKECLANGTNIILGPGVNIKHNVFCGRNFEYFSEDPYLAGILAANYINGLETNNVGACIKHFAVNSQEYARVINSSELSLRALNEIYLRNFKYALKYSSPTSIMTSYNKVNGVYVNESKYLLQNKIRNEYNFKGFICSDWEAMTDKGITIATGLNVEMPICNRSNEYLDKEYNITFTDKDLINRDNELYEAIKKFKKANHKIDFDFEKESKIVKDKIANGTIVLAKNNQNYLPLTKNESLLVLGRYAKKPYFVGQGSGWVNAYKQTSFLEILQKNNIKYEYLECFDDEKVLITKDDLKGKKYDKVLLFLGRTAKEDVEASDRKTLKLEKQQEEVFQLIKDNIKDFATIIITGSVIALEDIYHSSKAVMISYLAGENQAEALYDNLYNNYNPSGRLCETWINDVKQNPNMQTFLNKNMYYTYNDDDIYVGYRYYDLHKNGFILPFGYGLSYTTFKEKIISYKLDKEKIIIDVEIKNDGEFDGHEIIQLYVGKKDSSIYRPIKELKGFEKIFVKAHESKIIQTVLNLDDLTSYEEESDSFKLEDGLYQIYLCKNAFEIVDQFEIKLNGVIFAKHDAPIKLIRKENPVGINMHTPGKILFNNDIFKKFVLDNNINVNLKDFEKVFQWIEDRPLRQLISLFKMTYEQMDNLIDLLQNK